MLSSVRIGLSLSVVLSLSYPARMPRASAETQEPPSYAVSLAFSPSSDYGLRATLPPAAIAVTAGKSLEDTKNDQIAADDAEKSAKQQATAAQDALQALQIKKTVSYSPPSP